MTYQTFNFMVLSSGVLVIVLSFISDRHIVEGRPSPLDVSLKNQNLKIEDLLVPGAGAGATAAEYQDQVTLPLSVEKENDYLFLPAANFQILDENDDDYNSFNDSYFLFNGESDNSPENSESASGPGPGPGPDDGTNIQDILYVLHKLNQNLSSLIPIRNIASNNNTSGNGSTSESKYGEGDNSTNLSSGSGSGVDMDSSNIFWTNVTILFLLIFVALCLRCYVVERAQRRVELMVSILEQQIRHSESASASASASASSSGSGVTASLLPRPPTTSDTADDDKDSDSIAFNLNLDDEEDDDDDELELPSYNQAMGI